MHQLRDITTNRESTMGGTFQTLNQRDDPSRRLSILLVGQHPLAREGLLRLLEQGGSVKVIA